jgi:hypothetical protein
VIEKEKMGRRIREAKRKRRNENLRRKRFKGVVEEGRGENG